MDVRLPRRTQDSPDPIKNQHALWVRDAFEVAYDQVRCHAGQAVRRQKCLYDKRAVKRVLAVGDWTAGYYPRAKKCKLDSPWLGPYLVGVQLHPDSLVLLIHCQDLKIIPRPRGVGALASIEPTGSGNRSSGYRHYYGVPLLPWYPVSSLSGL